MAATNLIFYYFGDDEAYFRALQGEFKKHTRLTIDFRRVYEKLERDIQSLFLKVSQDCPVVVFIDFSKQTSEYMHLARLISRTSFGPKLTLVGLVDYLSPPEVIKESVATGVQLIYIKNSETFDVIFDIAKLIAPQEIAAHGFATATLKSEEWMAGIPTKVGYISTDGLHIETNHKISKGDRIKLTHAWSKSRVVPSSEVFVREVSQSNMYYHFQYNADLDFIFIDEFIPPEGMEEDKIKEKNTERNDLILFHKKQLKKWIEENRDNSQEKLAKVLIIDEEFQFYNNRPRTDKHPYTFRCLPSLKDPSSELARLQPQIIVFCFGKEGESNNNEALHSLVQVIKSGQGEDFRPFVIVFNTKITSKDMQSNFSYPFIMASEGDLSADIIIRMAEIIEKKIESSNKKNSPKVFIKKTNPASIAEILFPITILKLSESDLIFQTEHPIEIGINLHITKPVDMYIHVQPAKASGKLPEYTGLIHCLGEESKKELRKYVNSVFFRDHDAKLQAEGDEFKKLNEAKLQQKTAQEKATGEAALKAEEEKKQAEEEAKSKNS